MKWSTEAGKDPRKVNNFPTLTSSEEIEKWCLKREKKTGKKLQTSLTFKKAAAKKEERNKQYFFK